MANPRVRAFNWGRRWTKKDWAIATVGFTFTVFFLTIFSNSSRDDVSNVTGPLHPTTGSDFVDLTFLHSAKDRGALCLDGSIPGYHLRKGSGSGSSNWLLHIEGGGWCNTIASCSLRKSTPLGSSKFMDRRVIFSGILSGDPSQNPDFYNWNRVKIRYCDGASLAGHPKSEFKNETKLLFRGQLIWEVLIDELLSVGLSKAKQALLSGCSAGGLATLIHCDAFRELLPKDATVKCLADAGFFLDEKDILGSHVMRSFYHGVVHLQGVGESLQKDCLSRMDPSECLFPHQVIKSIKTPVFLVNPAYDFWQIQHVLVPGVSDHHGYWQTCRLNIHKCNPSQIKILQGSPDYYAAFQQLFWTKYGNPPALSEVDNRGRASDMDLLTSLHFPGFRDSLLRSLEEFQKNRNGGMFINSCFIHCQTWMAETWNSPTSPRINNQTIAQSVSDWYFNRQEVKLIDCPYPCNPTCIHMDFTQV